MKGRRFRSRLSASGETLALDPKAFGIFFSIGRSRDTELEGSVAIVKIEGPLEHKSNWCWDSYEAIYARFCEAIEDPSAQAIVLKIDSPGGDVDGLMETVKAMRAAKEASGKRVYAYADELAASAAYALSTVADEIYLPEAGGVGSIGVISMLGEQTRRDKKDGFRFEVVASGERKPDGNPHIEITDGARARVRKRVDDLAHTFFELVAEARGLSVDAVRGYQADVFYGSDAVAKRLADGVLSFSDVVENAQDDAITNTKGGQAADQKKKGNSMNLLALRKAMKAAEAKLSSAKTAAAKKSAKAEFDAAIKALADAEGSTVAKTVKKYKRMEETESEESDDSAEEDAEDDAAADDADDADADDDADDDSDADGDDDDDDDDAEDSEDSEDAADDSKKSKRAEAELLSVVREVTGKSNVREAIGALRGLGMMKGQMAVMSRQIGELTRKNTRDRVKSLVEGAIKNGKLMPSQRDAFLKIGMRDVKELRGLLDTMPKRVRMEDEDGALREAGAQGATELTEKEREIATRAGSLELYEKAKKDGKSFFTIDQFNGIEH